MDKCPLLFLDTVVIFLSQWYSPTIFFLRIHNFRRRAWRWRAVSLVRRWGWWGACGARGAIIEDPLEAVIATDVPPPNKGSLRLPSEECLKDNEGSERGSNEEEGGPPPLFPGTTVTDTGGHAVPHKSQWLVFGRLSYSQMWQIHAPSPTPVSIAVLRTLVRFRELRKGRMMGRAMWGKDPRATRRRQQVPMQKHRQADSSSRERYDK
mmetsp:Transcript_6200/g.8467  ORF Transcript_6200/g.8467 Transcript_6200/m.8467 type:complete len:208 (-) Transcript_6200:137-760(-)